MKIALLSWETLHSIPVGGVAVHVTELAAALERMGNEVHVFTRLAPFGPLYRRIDGVHYHQCRFHLDRNFVEEIQNLNRSMVHEVFEAENVGGAFDVIHAHDWLTANAMVWIKQGRGRRGVLTIHSTEYGRCGNNFWEGDCRRVRDHERNGTYCADRVITVSNALKGEVCWMYETPGWKVSVIYNGVHAQQFDGFIDPGAVKARYWIGPMDPTALFVGRMCLQKGPDILIGALPMILRYYPNAKFIFAGDGEQRGACEGLAHRLGVAHATRFLGCVRGSPLIDLYKACDVLVIPSRNEPFGIVVLEAWSAGKPVVATNHGGPGEIVWHGVTGLKIYPHPESVAWGVGNLFRDFEAARWMGRNGRRAAEEAFTWERIAEQTLGVYRSI